MFYDTQTSEATLPNIGVVDVVKNLTLSFHKNLFNYYIAIKALTRLVAIKKGAHKIR